MAKLSLKDFVAQARAKAEADGQRLPRTMKRPPRMVFPHGIEKDYDKRLRRAAHRWGQEVESALVAIFPRLAAEAARVRRSDDVGPTPEEASAWATELAHLMARMRERWGPRAEELRPVVARIGRGVSDHQYEQLQGVFRSVLGVDVLGSEPWLADELHAWGRVNAALIKDIGDRSVLRIEAMVSDTVRRGGSLADLKNGIADALGSTDKRARLIARDQVGKLNGDLNRLRQTGAGVESYRWRGMLDRRERYAHRGREGRTYRWDDPPPDGNPGEPVQCFPGDSILDTAYGVEKLYRRRYSGKLTVIVTETGEALRATANHPILTSRGWIPARDINVGDHVFKTSIERVTLPECDVERNETKFVEAFDAFAVIASPVRIAGAMDQFHGDGTDEQVDIVDVNRGLTTDFLATLDKQACEALLSIADMSIVSGPLSLAGAAFEIVGRLWGVPDGLVGGARKLFALLAGEATQADAVRAGAVADLDTGCAQSASNAMAIYAMLRSECELTHSGEICGDDLLGRKILAVMRRASAARDLNTPSAERLAQVVGVHAESLGDLPKHEPTFEAAFCVVEKRIEEYTGHVYNLQTSSGWYSTRGYIVHNCRCYAEPVLDEFADLLPRRNAPDWNAIGDRPRERRRWGPEFDKRSAAELDEERAAHPEKFRSPQRRGLRALPDQGVGAQRLSPRRINMSLAPTSDPSDLQNHEAFRFRNQRLNAAGNRVKRSLGGRWFLPRVRTWDAFHDPEIRDLYLRVWGDDADGLAGAQQTVRDWAFVKSDHANQIAMREAFGAIAEGRAPAGELGRRIEMLYQTRRERWARLADELGIPVPEKFRAWRGLGGDNGPLFVEAIVNAWRQPGDDPIVLPSHTLTSWSLNAKAATAFATNYGRSRTAGVIVEADIPFENTLMDKWVDDSAFVMPWAFQDEVIAATPRPDSLRAFKQSAVVYYQGTRYAYADREALFQAWDSNRPR